MVASQTWTMVDSCKHSSLLQYGKNIAVKSFIVQGHGVLQPLSIPYRNKLEWLSLPVLLVQHNVCMQGWSLPEPLKGLSYKSGFLILQQTKVKIAILDKQSSLLQTEIITAIKSFIVQTHGLFKIFYKFLVQISLKFNVYFCKMCPGKVFGEILILEKISQSVSTLSNPYKLLYYFGLHYIDILVFALIITNLFGREEARSLNCA